MDNAQVTSQMAQINTVSGIEKLNTTVQGLSTPVRAAAGGAGRVAGRPRRDRRRQQAAASTDAGVGAGRLRARRPRRPVKVEILGAERRGRSTRSTSAPQSAGVHSFDWPAGANATTASGLTLPRHRDERQRQRRAATTLMRDRVDAVSTSGNSLQPRARELGHRARTARSRPSTDLDEPVKEQRHELPARSFRSQRVEQEPRGDRQQHRQRQHLRRQGRRAPSSPTSTPTR